ncbi:hypothetical protein [Glaciimonas soli]|uniref:Uncharacterized protein n=1 Tax=Glaciimonas soli TaxID=2590999 RepID=A0A843YXA1_9BURK|nr:hypothetical protein [Glaciimonas soli]MQR02363.1 hypothetical protein [Glaciimonas soli]
MHLPELVIDNDSNTRDGWFTPFRITTSASLKLLINDVANEIGSYESEQGLRRRKRKPADRMVFMMQIEAFICDAALHHLEKPGGYLSVTRSKRKLGIRDRYRSSVMSETLPDLLDRLGQLGLLEVHIGAVNVFDPVKNKQTTFRASALLLARLAPLQLSIADFSVHQEKEVIVLKQRRLNSFEAGAPLQYADTSLTVSYRHNMNLINAWIGAADIDFLNGHGVLRLNERRLRRVFNNGSFTQGGRLFGGWWQDMKKLNRRDICIEGISAVTLDFSQAGARIMYGIAGAACDHDPYAVSGYEHHRDGIKRLFAAMAFSSTPIKRFPKNTKKLFRGDMKVKQVTEAIQAHNKEISHLFYTGVGFDVIHRESEIMVEMLLTLQALGVVALPVHDALIVAEDRVAEVKAVMLSVFHAQTGVEGSVEVECQ